MKQLKFLLFTLTTLFFISCKTEYNSEKCNELSMRSFKGSPQAAHEFNQNCQEIEITFTHQKCQNALNDLIMSGSLKTIRERYPKGIKGCFSQNDLNKFNLDDQ